jgi:hypothetical protein
MPHENPITDSIMRMLKKIPHSFALKIHGSAYQRRGMPDIMFLVTRARVVYGRADMPESLVWMSATFFFEVKVPGKKATKLQAETLKRLWAAGAKAEVVYSKSDVREILEANGVR